MGLYHKIDNRKIKEEKKVKNQKNQRNDYVSVLLQILFCHFAFDLYQSGGEE